MTVGDLPDERRVDRAEEPPTLTQQQFDYLVAVSAGQRPAIPPMMVRRLVRVGLLRAAEPPRPPREGPGRRRAPPPRRYRVTEAGTAAIARFADQMREVGPSGPENQERGRIR